MIRFVQNLVAALFASVAISGPAGAAQIAGQHFDDRLQLGDATLQLNGVGLRAVAWLKGYAAGLYLTERAHSPAAAASMAGPKRLQMKMMLEVEAKEFAKAIDKGLHRNTPAAERPQLAARQRQFRDAVLALKIVRSGDVVNLDYIPGRGMTMTVNGAVRSATLPGDDFYVAVLRIFIGDDPVDDDLKAGLLGRAPS